MHRSMVFYLLVALISPPVFSDGDELASLQNCGLGIVAHVPSGDILKLADNSTVALADIKAPELWPNEVHYKSWPYGSSSKSALNTLVIGKSVTLLCGKNTHNALGQLVAHVQLSDDVWVQQMLLGTGHSFFYPTSGDVQISQALYAAEKKARTKKVGLWAGHIYQVAEATGTELKPGWFQLVQGQVVSTAKVRKTIYLNFGENWRDDFTIQLNTHVEKQLQAQGITPLSLEGSDIEVRGWVEWSGGPKIILTHPNQLQILTVGKTR